MLRDNLLFAAISKLVDEHGLKLVERMQIFN